MLPTPSPKPKQIPKAWGRTLTHPLPPQSHISLAAGSSIAPINIPAGSTRSRRVAGVFGQDMPGYISEHRRWGGVVGAIDEAVPQEEMSSPSWEQWDRVALPHRSQGLLVAEA